MLLQPVGKSAAGTFQLMRDDSGKMVALIRYDPRQLDDLPTLVATLAHELSHYLLSTASTSFPGWAGHA